MQRMGMERTPTPRIWRPMHHAMPCKRPLPLDDGGGQEVLWALDASCLSTVLHTCRCCSSRCQEDHCMLRCTDSLRARMWATTCQICTQTAPLERRSIGTVAA